jgi:hypothetical protein
MAADKKYVFQKENREKIIAKCTTCNGAPPKEHTVLQGMEIDFCTLCSQVVDWTKVGKPIKVKETKVVAESIGSITQYKQEDREFIPGGEQLKFTDLDVI